VTTTEPVAVTPTEPPPAVFDAGATLLTRRFSPVEAGTYRVDTLGTAMSLTLNEPLFTQRNQQGEFVLSHEASNGPDDRDIVLMRLSHLVDPTLSSIPDDIADAAWPVDDFDGWLDNLGDGATISGRAETTLGGLAATRVELSLSQDACLSGEPFCVLGTNHLATLKVLDTGSTYRVWMVDQAGNDPLVVVVAINRDSDSEWFDTAESVLSTLAFGEVEPNPVINAPAGAIEVPFLGGVNFTLAEPALVLQEPLGVGAIRLYDQPAAVEFLINPTNIDGNALNTPADLIALLEGAGVEVIPAEPTTIDGVATQVFDIGTNESMVLLNRSPESELDWRAPERGRIWLIEHPERGLLMINAEAGGDIDTTFPTLLEFVEPMLTSMEFVDAE
jgi:hypothetical protein